MRLQSAIFDMDGTLLDSMPAWRGLLPSLLERTGAHAPFDVNERLKTMSAQEGAAFCRDVCGLTWSVDEIFHYFADEMAEFYRHQVQTKPGVPAFLERLHRQGVSMYVATATEGPLARIALESTGLLPYFQGVLTPDDVPVHKSDGPAIYLRAMECMGAAPEETLVFEDAVYAVRSAKSAGFRVVGVWDKIASAHEAEILTLTDCYIHSFDELTDEALARLP